MEKHVAFRYDDNSGEYPVSVAQYWIENDGGRSKYFKGTAGDCVTRAIAIATEQDYKVVYDALRSISGKTPRDGVKRKVYEKYILSLGWKWKPLMFIGSGCTTHVREDELPKGRLILSLSRHLVAFIDGNLHDTYDSSREGTRCVYGYYYKPEEPEKEKFKAIRFIKELIDQEENYISGYGDSKVPKNHKNRLKELREALKELREL